MPTPPRRWPLKDRNIVKSLRRLAGESDKVHATTRSMRDLAALRITIAGVCQAVCDWIDAGDQIMETITGYDEEHVGEPAYELYPVIDGTDMFIKATICERGSDRELLLVISAHR
jgi:hypothetical protein